MRTLDSSDRHSVGERERVEPDGTHPRNARPRPNATAVAADTRASDGERAVASASGHTPTSRDHTRDVDERDGGRDASVERSPAREWLLVAPLAATLLAVAVGLHFGFGVFDPGASGDVSLLPYLALVPYFLLGLAGTLWLVEDASLLATADADWQPNPWLYVLAGALVLEVVVAAPVLRGEVTTNVVPYLAGGFVLAAVLSSVVVGPIYLLVRRRKLGI